MDVCRTCLTKEVSKYILDLHKSIEEYHARESKTSTEIMQFCLDIEIGPIKNTSTQLCENCFFKIIDIYKFKEQALKNQEYFKLHSNNEDTKTHLLVNNSSYEHLDVNLNYSLGESTKFEVKAEITVKEENESDVGSDFESDDNLLSVIRYENVEENLIEKQPTMQVKKDGECIETATKKEQDINERCTVYNKSVKHLKPHIALHDSLGRQRKIYTCKFCDKEFKSKSAFYRHTRIKHHGIKAHCDLCKKDVVDLKSHTLTVHDASNLPYECNICSQRFITPSRLKTHSVLHTKEKPFSCVICNKSFSNIHLLSQHKRSVHDKERPHQCQFCPKSFFKTNALAIHLRSHSKEKPYECKICGKWFSSSTVLKKHKQLHATDKSNDNDHKHMVVHTKEKNYPCKYCGAMFSRADHRNWHEKNTHENYK